MIEDFKALAVFVTVSETGSFSEAGRRLGLSTSVISHHVSKLETGLSTSLFFRSTRSISLTPEGERILPAARRMMEAGSEALDLLAETSDQPTGSLRITLPSFGDNSAIHQAVWGFAQDHPQVEITLEASDQQMDLIKGGFDIAIRLGRLKDSALKSRKVGEFRRVLVAAACFVEKHGPIGSLEALAQCDFISMVMLPDYHTLVRSGPTGLEEVEIAQEKIRLKVNSVSSAKAAVRAGLGVQVLPSSEVESELADGSLVHLLPEWSVPMANIYAVWPENGPQKKLTRRFIDHLVAKAQISLDQTA
ncbi:MAG: LysR family transcriptional regulator [Pseudomonadota bacterium]